MNPVRLAEAVDVRAFGGKAASLGAAVRAGLNVPAALIIGVEDAAVFARSADDKTLKALHQRVFGVLGDGPLAVRSSALGEDSINCSFAGQHASRLNVLGAPALGEAIRIVWSSAWSSAALSYRARLGIPGEPGMAVIIQRLVPSDSAGVLFTRNPVSGADERVVEAAWGFGEAVAAGLVTPDRWRFQRGGKLLEQCVGEKDLEIVAAASGTETRRVTTERAGRPCLDPIRLQALDDLAARCEACFAGPSDVEWAFAGDTLYVLQRRSVTR
jgi:pyruvate,water dikinase